MRIDTFNKLRNMIEENGYKQEVHWAESIKPCANADDFFAEYMWVVISSGMKNQIAELIDGRIWDAINEGKPIESVFGHKGKVEAIKKILGNRGFYFSLYNQSGDKLGFLETLPYIGEITKYHLAKNLGIDTIKPDRHLERIASEYGISCFEMCQKLSSQTGLRMATIDQIIWRAANLGFV